jgi:hypothetical protein
MAPDLSLRAIFRFPVTTDFEWRLVHDIRMTIAIRLLSKSA